MNLIKYLFGKSNPSAANSVKSGSTEKTVPVKKKRSKKTKKAEPDAEPDSILRAKSLLKGWNSGESVEKRIEQFSSDNTKVVFEDGLSITARILAECACSVLCPSFPDLNFAWKSIHVDPGNPKIVYVEDIVCSGTHTGTPYTFNGLPPIEASGTKCSNDPERMILHLDDDYLIRKLEIIALGGMTGLMGFYEQLSLAK